MTSNDDGDDVYEITADETVEQFGYTLVQTLGSWGPTQEFRRYLENRTEERKGVTAYFSMFGGKYHPWKKHQPMGLL